MILLGMKKAVLSSDLIWMCALCYNCSFHCPQNVKFENVMEVLRKMAVNEGYVHPAFMETICQIDHYTQEVRLKMIRSVLEKKVKAHTIKPEAVMNEVIKNHKGGKKQNKGS